MRLLIEVRLTGCWNVGACLTYAQWCLYLLEQRVVQQIVGLQHLYDTCKGGSPYCIPINCSIGLFKISPALPCSSWLIKRMTACNKMIYHVSLSSYSYGPDKICGSCLQTDKFVKICTQHVKQCKKRTLAKLLSVFSQCSCGDVAQCTKYSDIMLLLSF